MRMGAAAAWSALLILPLLAGCSGGDAPPTAPAGLAAADLQAGRFYSFTHAGGPLVFTLAGDGDAAFDLYDGDDRRLGSVGFTSEAARSGLHRIDGVAAGDLVLRLQTLNGTLQVASDGHAVPAFRPLTDLIERVVLVDRAPRVDLLGLSSIGLAGLPLPGSEPADERLDVLLRRAPADLRVLATGPFANLTVTLGSPRGTVLTATGLGGIGPGLALEPPRSFIPLEATTTLQNLRDGALAAHVTADDLAGAVILESRTFSRATLPLPSPAGPALADVAFTYGGLNAATPIAFQVHRDARHLYLWQTGPVAANASVLLFDGHDHRLAVVHVPATGTADVALAEGGGDYVAVLLAGKALLGADVAPADFELRELATSETVYPQASAGEGDGRYAIASQAGQPLRAYALAAATRAAQAPDPVAPAGSPLATCAADRLLRIEQDGEAIVAVVEAASGRGELDEAPFAAGTLALRDGPITVAYDGFGEDGCNAPAVRVTSYERSL